MTENKYSLGNESDASKRVVKVPPVWRENNGIERKEPTTSLSRPVPNPSDAPPRPFPLFNRTFAPMGGKKYWKRLGALELTFTIIFSTFCGILYYFAPYDDPGLVWAMALIFLGGLPFLTFFVAPQWALFFLTLFEVGAEGRGRVGKWRKGAEYDAFLLTCSYVALAVVSYLPICLLLLYYDLYFSDFERFVYVGVIGSVLFPIFLLSTRMAENPLQILQKDVLITLATKFHIWLQLFVVSVCVFFAPFICVAPLREQFHEDLATLFFPTFLLFFSGSYALILGKASRIIKDARRKSYRSDKDKTFNVEN